MTGGASIFLSLLMLAGFLLVIGGVYMIAKRHDRTKGVLMIICAVVMWGNVAIMTL